jgi:hypothetical protein
VTRGADWAAGVARWWVMSYTRTAPVAAAADRRAEIESDLFEHVRSGADAGDARLARSIIGRTLRGVVDDLSWRLEVERAPGRLDWHLAHPTTLLGVGLVLDCALETVWDSSVHRFPLITPLAELVHPALLLLWAVSVSWVVVGATRIRRRRRLRYTVTATTWRGASICAMSVAFALAGLWRSAPNVFGAISALAWVTFNIALVVFVATWLARPLRSLRTLLDFRKIPS